MYNDTQNQFKLGQYNASVTKHLPGISVGFKEIHVST